MTDSPKYPRPSTLELAALSDAAWDIRDCDEAYFHGEDNPDKWLSWLTRYEGFGDFEIQAEVVKSHNGTPGIHITRKD